jgi:flagellar biosynthesis GTPase FlhF
MAASYDDAAAELFQAPHAGFVNERKRLAAELKAAGDKAGATRLGKINRPPVSAWAVNQLWWKHGDDFALIFESAARVRDGDLGATAAHRETIAKLRGRAAAILAEDGHAATEGTLRRVTQTLQALAAIGGFDPDQPGMLAEDRDPPGFEALGIGPGPAPVSAPPLPRASPPKAVAAKPAAADDDADDGDGDADVAAARAEAAAKAAAEAAEKRKRDAEEARAKAEAAAEKRRAEEAEARKVAERNRIEAAIRTGKGEVEARVREQESLRKQLASAESRVAAARAVVADLEARLAELT